MALYQGGNLVASVGGGGSKPTITTVTLTSSGWDSTALTQTVAVPGVLADESAQLITLTPAISSQTSYYDNALRCSNQNTDSLTFICDSIPSEDITVYIVIQDM